VRCQRSRIFLLLFYSFAVISILASNRLDAASLQLTWLDNSQNEDGFYIERKLGTNGTFSLIATVGPNVASYSDDNLADSTTYCYRVNAFNGAGSSAYTNQACGTASAIPAPPLPPFSPVTATLLGQTGEDIAGTTAESPDGIQDVHIRLSGVQSAITSVRITDDGSGVWETPYSGWWIVAIRPQTNASLVDLYFDFWQSTSTYTLNMAFANGTTQTIQISDAASTPPPPFFSTIAATLLGQTGEDIAGTTAESPDGIQDVHIRLSGVQSAITSVRITDGGDGVWETPYSGWWIVAIRPHTDPSLVDLHFDFWQPSSSYTLNLAFANGTIQTIQTSAALSLQLLGNSP
jgi:hypothetical protein